MLQEPEKEAPGSIDSLFATISPFSFDVDFKECSQQINKITNFSLKRNLDLEMHTKRKA